MATEKPLPSPPVADLRETAVQSRALQLVAEAEAAEAIEAEARARAQAMLKAKRPIGDGKLQTANLVPPVTVTASRPRAMSRALPQAIPQAVPQAIPPAVPTRRQRPYRRRCGDDEDYECDACGWDSPCRCDRYWQRRGRAPAGCCGGGGGYPPTYMCGPGSFGCGPVFGNRWGNGWPPCGYYAPPATDCFGGFRGYAGSSLCGWNNTTVVQPAVQACSTQCGVQTCTTVPVGPPNLASCPAWL
jgi:hypothetical protein